jgi:hypothetical protein
MLTTKPRFLITAFLALTALPASAGVIYSTGVDAGGVNPLYDTTTGSSRGVSMLELSSGPILILAESFSLSTSSAVTDLLVPLSQVSATGPFSTTRPLDFYILPDSAGLPESDQYGNPQGALYTGVSAAITGTAAGIYDIGMTGSTTLNAGTTYWLLAELPGSNPGPNAGNFGDEWYHYSASTKPGGYETAYNSGGWGAVGNPTMAFTLVNGTAATSSSTPEPASFMLLAIGTGFIVSVRRKI